MLPRWVTRAVIAATAITIIVAFVGAYEIGAYFDPMEHVTGSALRGGPAFGLSLALAWCWLPDWRLPRALRVAVLLPIVQAIAIVTLVIAWKHVSATLPYSDKESPLVTALPFAYVVAAGAAFVLVAGRVIAWGRRREWLQASAILSLGLLVTMGVWLPLVANTWGPTGRSLPVAWSDIAHVVLDRQLMIWAFVPPAVVSIAFAWFAVHRSDAVVRARSTIAMSVAVMLGMASLVRLAAGFGASIVYANFIHVLLALVVVAAGTLALLTGSLWLRARHDRRLFARSDLVGVIDGKRSEAVAWLQIAGWWRGLRTAADAFTVTSDRGPIIVPAGAAIVCAPSPRTLELETGAETAVLRAGDRVTLVGFVAPDPGDPFRGASAMLPGPGGVVVGSADLPRVGFAEVALSTWRPCLAYLLAVVAVAIPALVGVLAL